MTTVPILSGMEIPGPGSRQRHTLATETDLKSRGDLTPAYNSCYILIGYKQNDHG